MGIEEIQGVNELTIGKGWSAIFDKKCIDALLKTGNIDVSFSIKDYGGYAHIELGRPMGGIYSFSSFRYPTDVSQSELDFGHETYVVGRNRYLKEGQFFDEKGKIYFFFGGMCVNGQKVEERNGLYFYKGTDKIVHVPGLEIKIDENFIAPMALSEWDTTELTHFGGNIIDATYYTVTNKPNSKRQTTRYDIAVPLDLIESIKIRVSEYGKYAYPEVDSLVNEEG